MDQETVCVLHNISGRVLGFGGSPSRGGIQVMPNEEKHLTKSDVEWILNDPTIRAVIRSGVLLDPLKAIDLSGTPNVKAFKARKPGTRSAPGVVGAPSPAPVRVAPDAPESLADLDEPRALAHVATCEDLEVLKRWYNDERKEIKDAINKRGHVILNAQNGRAK